ncbi:hypothetical protein AX16_009923 [Volvariella volvacea WC 439]|nr:hypothetical protein AX16_009923 [Volvariella volvacea WC 439]
MRTLSSSALLTIRNLIIRLILRILCFLFPSVNALNERIKQSPGLPVPDPCTPYWLVPSAPISEHGSSPDSKLPEHADVVIIGSGITGTGFARTLLDYDDLHSKDGESLHVVMLEAREICSGATGRNGGHITPPLYQEYVEIVHSYGASIAKKIMDFRRSHIRELMTVAEEEDLLEESQCRGVETFDVYHNKSAFADAKRRLARYLNDLPSEKEAYSVYETRESLESLQFSAKTVGSISRPAGAVHPYRLVTGILARLLESYPNFHLFAKTPVTEIHAPDTADSHWYTVTTPRGNIKARHVIHATNGWASHLLPRMRMKIVPTRACMTAQKPRPGLGEQHVKTSEKTVSEDSWTGKRSFTFFPLSYTDFFDYLTQQPARNHSPSFDRDKAIYPPSEGELMFGGGFSKVETILTEFGSSDDRTWDRSTEEYLRSALGKYFTVNSDDSTAKEEIKSVWGGILGVSVDRLPWVGRIPTSVTGRIPPSPGRAKEGAKTPLSAPGEWIAAGFSGEGMVHAWLSAKALAYMVLGSADGISANPKIEPALESWFPEVFRMTEERWEKATIENLIASLL